MDASTSNVALADVQSKASPSRAVVSIASVVSCFVFLIVMMFAIFASDQMIVAGYIAGALAAMGVCLGWLVMRYSAECSEGRG